MFSSDSVVNTDNKCRQYLTIRNRPFLVTGLFISYLLISSTFVFRYFKEKSSSSGLRNDILSVLFQTASDFDSIDIHVEDVSWGHTGEVSHDKSHRSDKLGRLYTTVAIGGGITSKGVRDLSPSNVVASFQLFNTFLPTFCATASPGYAYHFYFAYDISDSFFALASSLRAFKNAFESITSAKCNRNMTLLLHLVQCSHAGKPTWAQNDAMREAYLDNIDYYYRINDDTQMQTEGWMEEFRRTLSGYNPPNVGVVGPNHSGGNTFILTYDFVHRTHVEVFGFYYPRLFTDWWGDDWITGVYVPGRSTKLNNVRLAHTMTLGQRYSVDQSVGRRYTSQIDRDKQTLNRYISHRESVKSQPVVDGKKIISMSLYGKNTQYTWGAIRNAQIVRIHFPDWRLRIYILDPSIKEYPSLIVPTRIINKLRHLDVEIALVKNMPNTPPHMWRYMIIDDKNVDFFLIRDADGRLSDRDAAAVTAWLARSAKDPSLSLHCIRDHPNHAKTAIVDGMWAGRTKIIRKILGENINSLLRKFFTSQSGSGSDKFLSDVLWPALKSTSLCHDSVSCDVWTNSEYLSRARVDHEYVGETFDEHQERASKDYQQLKDMNGLHCNKSRTYLLT